ncbi:hypothetical protein EBR43_05510 [bacterium]|nr:hypothetical protein [bacterium]
MTICFTLNDHIKKRLLSLAASFSSYDKPPVYQIPLIRSKIKKFFLDELTWLVAKSNLPLWQQIMIFQKEQVEDLLDCLPFTYAKRVYKDKDFIDYFYQISEVDGRSLSTWKHRYTVWNEELMLLWKRFLLQYQPKKSIFIFNQQVLCLSSDAVKSFFIDILGHRIILKETGATLLVNKNEIDALLHRAGVMKAGLPCAVDAWQNYSLPYIKRLYKKRSSIILSLLMSLYDKNHMLNHFDKIESKITYLFDKSYLLTVKKKCNIPNCKAKQST